MFRFILTDLKEEHRESEQTAQVMNQWSSILLAHVSSPDGFYKCYDLLAQQPHEFFYSKHVPTLFARFKVLRDPDAHADGQLEVTVGHTYHDVVLEIAAYHDVVLTTPHRTKPPTTM